MGALVAVNAVGDVRDPDSGTLLAGTRDEPDGRTLIDSAARDPRAMGLFAGPGHTTIGVVATNARLDRAQAAEVASLGLLGFARALSPPHTAFDGDTLFALSVGDLPADVTPIGLAAAEAVGRDRARGASRHVPPRPSRRLRPSRGRRPLTAEFIACFRRKPILN